MAGKFKLIPHLERCIQDFDEEWTFTYKPKEHDLYWHPSSDCVPPPSALYESALRRLNGEPNPDAGRMRKYGFVGHFWHQYLQHLLVRYELAEPKAIERQGFKGWGEDFGLPKDFEQTIFQPFHVCVGSADVAPANIPRHGDYLIDFKTMGSVHFKAVALPDFFREKYECQINIYMDFFDYDKALIVGINKDTPHDMKEIEYRRNDELVEAIYNKWKFISECLEHNEPPSELDDADFELPLEQL